MFVFFLNGHRGCICHGTGLKTSSELLKTNACENFAHIIQILKKCVDLCHLSDALFHDNNQWFGVFLHVFRFSLFPGLLRTRNS